MRQMVLLRRVVRILQLLEDKGEFETARCAQGLSTALGEGFSIERRTIGAGGDFRDVPTGAAALRRRHDCACDIVHAWGAKALTTAALIHRVRYAGMC